MYPNTRPTVGRCQPVPKEYVGKTRLPIEYGPSLRSAVGLRREGPYWSKLVSAAHPKGLLESSGIHTALGKKQPKFFSLNLSIRARVLELLTPKHPFVSTNGLTSNSQSNNNRKSPLLKKNKIKRCPPTPPHTMEHTISFCTQPHKRVWDMRRPCSERAWRCHPGHVIF